MKKLVFCMGFALLVAGLSVSCGNSTGEVSKQDSLSIENQQLNEFLDIVAYTMDSINGQEKYLYMITNIQINGMIISTNGYLIDMLQLM